MRKDLIFAMMAAILLFASCNGKKTTKGDLTSGINFENMDTTADPTQDFYRYACGGWMDKHPLTPEYSRFGSFDKLAEDNREQIKGLISDIAKESHEKGTDMQKVADLYNLGMDSAAIEKQGVAPIRESLEAVNELKSLNELPEFLASMHLAGNAPFFAFFPEADPKNSSMNIAWIYQTGLGIGDRDYYLLSETQPIRDEYKKLVTKMLQISGYANIAKFEGKEEVMAEAVLKMETLMAEAFMNREDARIPEKSYNPKSIEEFQSLIPNFDVKNYLSAMGFADLKSVNVAQVNYIKGLNNILKNTNIETIKAYLAWNIINSAASYLTAEMVETDFNFYGRVLSGKEEMQPRWKRVLNTVSGGLGEVVGKLYVEKYFPAQAKERMTHLVNNVKAALGERIMASTWMQDSTKDKAIDKLNSMYVKIGYPDKWRDYSDLQIEKDSYYANVMRISRFETSYQLSKIGKPVDPTEWLMAPQIVNAYYQPTTNEICFPAAILQPPFFDMNADDAVNYGAIGVVIGHEMTHGFDDQGRKYDKQGNMTDWWSQTDSANFAARTQLLVDHFNKIEVASGVFANGSFTLGENIADNGGLNIAYQAMQKAIADGEVQGKMDGFTPEQRFYIAYATVWASNIRPEEILRLTKEDPHSLAKWRVNGTLPHIPAFLQAFDVKENDAMWLAPEKRALIW